MPQTPALPATPAPLTPPPAAPAGVARQATWDDLLQAEAKKNGVDPRLAAAMMSVESSGNPSAVSPAGAQGLMQLMPETARRLGVDPNDPVQNIRGGVKEIKRLLDANQGDVVTTLRQYNASPGADPAVTEPYVQAVLKRIKPSSGAGAGQAAAQAGAPPLMPAHDPFAPTPPAPPQSWGQWAWEGAKGVASAFDPRQPEGRRNLAGATGAVAGGALAAATAPVSIPAGLVTLGGAVLGAGIGGAAAEGGEQVAGTKPPSLPDVGWAGAQQGAYELAGQGLIWPLKAAGRRLVASSVGRSASEWLSHARNLTIAQLEDGLDAATRSGQVAKDQATQTLRGARDTAATGIRGARTAARTGVEQAKAAGEADVAAVQGRYEQATAGTPPPHLAGRAANAVMEGPATATRNRLGQAVDSAARNGPPVDITKLKASAQEILAKLQPPERTFPRIASEEAADLPSQARAMGLNVENLRSMTANTGPAAGVLEQAQAAGTTETLKHPAFGVIQRILNADDIIPFHDAHLWKSELQNALAGTYDQTQKKQVTSITQHLAGELRTALAGHEPYNQATGAYKQIVPLFTKEYAARLKRTALTDPEALVRAITTQKPTAAGMLRDLLVEMPKGTGREAEGQQAWDLVRSAWTKSKVLNGGIEKLGEKLDGLPPEFVDAFYGDASGQQVLKNLKQLADAYGVATQRASQGVEAARGAGRSGIDAAQASGRAQVQSAQQAADALRQGAQTDVQSAREALRYGRRPTSLEEKFAKSTVAGRHSSPEQIGADVMKATVLGPGSTWGGLAMMRLLRGPAEHDLLEWAAYSTKGTQTLVKLMTGQSPTGQAIADLVRASGILQPAHGKPPAAPLTPPPGPPDTLH